MSEPFFIVIPLCKVWLVENQSCDAQQKRMLHGSTGRVTWKVMYTGVHHLDRSRRWSISSAVYETPAGSRELFPIRLLIKQWIVRRNNIWRWQQNFEKRNNSYMYTKILTKQLLHAVTWVHGFCTPSSAISPLGCTKRHGPVTAYNAAFNKARQAVGNRCPNCCQLHTDVRDVLGKNYLNSFFYWFPTFGADPEYRMINLAEVPPLPAFHGPILLLSVATTLDKLQEFLVRDHILCCLKCRNPKTMQLFSTSHVFLSFFCEPVPEVTKCVCTYIVHHCHTPFYFHTSLFYREWESKLILSRYFCLFLRHRTPLIFVKDQYSHLVYPNKCIK